MTPWSTVLLAKLTVAQVFKIFHILWNLNTHYHVHNSLPLIPTRSQTNPNHIPLLYEPFYIRFIFALMARSSLWSLSFKFSNQNAVCSLVLISPTPTTPPASVNVFDMIILLMGYHYVAPHYAVFSSFLSLPLMFKHYSLYSLLEAPLNKA